MGALLAATLIAACATEIDPDDDGGNTAGTSTSGSAGSSAGRSGGAAGNGGKSGAGGTAAGMAGMAGKAGSAGGSGTGGANGGAGSGGTSGAGGTTGGTSAGGAQAGGSSGSSGSGAGGVSGSSGAGGADSSGSGGGGVGGGSGGATGGKGGASTGGTGGSAAGSAGAAGSGGSGGGGTQSAGCGKARTLMNGRKTIQSGGNREYILRVPDNYDNTHPYRLIIAYHWLSGNAQQVAEGGNGGSTEDPYYGLWDLAENSTIFVAPEGLDAGWANTNNRDINLTDAILAQIEGDLCIDTTRIFATGFSYGAGMSYAIACARADVFRGVALYAGAQLSGCTGGTTPIAYFHVHGTNDSVLNISQGRSLRDHYVMVNGCTAQSPQEPANNSGMHICTSYQGCSEGHPTRWCAHDGDHNPTQKDRGQNKSWVPGEAWNFIKQF